MMANRQTIKIHLRKFMSPPFLYNSFPALLLCEKPLGHSRVPRYFIALCLSPFFAELLRFLEASLSSQQRLYHCNFLIKFCLDKMV